MIRQSRQMLNSAWNRASQPVGQLAIAARVLNEQDQEPWKRKFDAYSNAINANRAKREADRLFVEQHPWRAFVCLAVRKMFK